MEQTVRLNLDTRQFDRGISRATAALGAIVSIAAVKGVADLADRFQQVNARLRLVTGSSENFIKTQKALNAVANATRGSLEETTDLFSRLARSTADTAISQEQLLTATTAINQAIKVSGASSQEANAAIVQLGQGLASGALRGDELRSVLEQTPRLAQAIAAGLGVTIGELRELGTEGKLTTEVVLNALQNQAPQIAAEFSKIPPTIADSFTALNNAVLQSTEVLNQAGFGAVLSGIAQGAQDSLGAISQAFKALLPAQDLQKLQQDIRLAFTDSLIFVLKGVAAIEGPLNAIFDTVKAGINGIVRFANQLPPEAQLFGLIGFFLVGRGIKILLLTIAAFFDQIKGFMDKTVKYFENKINDMIDIYNNIVTAIGIDPLDKVVFGDGAFSSMVDEVNNKFVDFMDNAVVGLKEIGDTSTNSSSKIQKIIDSLAKAREEAAKPLPQPKVDAGMPKVDTGKTVSIGGPSQKELDKQKEQLDKAFLQLSQSLYTETQALQVEYEKKLTLLDDYYMQTEMADRDYYRMKEALEKKHQKSLEAISKARVNDQVNIFKNGQFQMLDFTEMTEKEKVKFAVEAGTSVLQELGKQNKAAFQAAKALAIAQAVINTAQGATKALAQGGVFGPILAGLVVAAGAVQIAAINSQQYQGRQSGGLVQKGQPYVVGEAGSEMFIPNRTGTIIPNGNMGGGQNVNVTFNINAVDAAGVDELLVNRRATITNIIRDAAQQKGQRSPV